MSLGVPGKRNRRPTGLKEAWKVLGVVIAVRTEVIWDDGLWVGPKEFRHRGEFVEWETEWRLVTKVTKFLFSRERWMDMP